MFSIPDAKEVIDLILSKTQRKTPSVVHRQFSIQKVRQFYLKKIKFLENNFKFIIEKILKNFPLIDQLHPFFCDLLNIFFNRDNYKISLNSLYKTKTKITSLTQNHLKLLKHSNSLYSCKQIKKALFGKVCKRIKKINNSLIFLEKIRCQIENLPKIDPHRKTVLLGGYSGTGKSCLMNKITRTNVIIRNNGNTTQFLNLGHINNNFFKWQIIDTPGITKTNLKFLNSIEIQTLAALINLDYRIIFLFDLKSNKQKVKNQVKTFLELRKLLKKKEKIFILGKTDLGWEKKLNLNQKSFLTFLKNFDEKCLSSVKCSFHDEIGILDIRDKGFCLGEIKKNNQKLINIENKKRYMLVDQNTGYRPVIETGEKTKIKIDHEKGQKKIREIDHQLLLIKKKKNLFDYKIGEKEILTFLKEEKYREFFSERKFVENKINGYTMSMKQENFLVFFPSRLRNLNRF